MTLLSKIKKLCQDNGNISINRLEKEAGLTRGSISKWDDHAPSYDKIKKVADYFGKTTEFFLSEGETKKADSNKADSLSETQYHLLNSENRAVIDNLIEKLLKSQSDE